jgi:taurine dioxygenase
MLETQFDVRPMTIGAEIIGLASGNESNPANRSALYEAWLRYGFLLFRDIATSEQHLAISRCFGELEMHPFPEVRCRDNPLLTELGGSTRTVGYVYDGSELRVNRLAWHRDSAFTPDVCKGAMLRMVETPPSEGETAFADTAAAYDDLPDMVKARLEGLEYKASFRLNPMTLTWPRAFWRTARPATSDEDPQGGFRQEDTEATATFPAIVHPAVLRHPESGRTCLFLSPNHVDHFLGMALTESEALLKYLVRHMLQPRYVYEHRWSVNDAILWDNRRVMHAAMGWKPGQMRRALRTTLAGPLRTGRLYDASPA